MGVGHFVLDAVRGRHGNVHATRGRYGVHEQLTDVAVSVVIATLHHLLEIATYRFELRLPQLKHFMVNFLKIKVYIFLLI